MNWLMWIGGGILWGLILFVIPASLLDTVAERTRGYEILKWIWSLSASWVWIWICWRFIR